MNSQVDNVADRVSGYVIGKHKRRTSNRCISCRSIGRFGWCCVAHLTLSVPQVRLSVIPILWSICFTRCIPPLSGADNRHDVFAEFLTSTRRLSINFNARVHRLLARSGWTSSDGKRFRRKLATRRLLINHINAASFTANPSPLYAAKIWIVKNALNHFWLIRLPDCLDFLLTSKPYYFLPYATSKVTVLQSLHWRIERFWQSC